MAFKPAEGESADGEGAIMAEINITPLTDIFLVLLIIFMVTSSVMSQLGVNVNLPAASHAISQSQPEGVIVSLLPGGNVAVNDQKVPPGNYDQLEKLLKAAFQKTSSRLVILDGDRKALLGSAVEVMDHARHVGAERFAIATTPQGKKRE